MDRVVGEMQRLIGDQGASAIRQVLESSAGFGKGAWAITVGVVTLMLGASVVFAELQSALNQIWGVKSEVRRGLVLDLVLDRLRSFSIALGVGFLLLVSLVLSAALSALQDYLTNWMPALPWLWQAGNIAISFVVVAILFAMVYKFLPDVQIEWRDVWIGAVVTSILFNGGKYLISIYLGHAAIGSAFGAAGSFAVLLVWIYYSALISFFGAEFTQVYARRHGRQIKPEAHARGDRKTRSLGNLARGVPAGPGPLEIVAAQPAGHIDHFADEIKSRHPPRFHRFGRQLAGFDSAHGHFGFGIALRALRSHRPLMNEPRDLFEFGSPRLLERFGRRITTHTRPRRNAPAIPARANPRRLFWFRAARAANRRRDAPARDRASRSRPPAKKRKPAESPVRSIRGE